MQNEFVRKRESIVSLVRASERKLERYKGISNKYSAVRLIFFISGAVVTIYLFTTSSFAGWISLILFLLSFGVIVHFHNRLLEGMRRLSAYRNLLNEDIARMDLEWEKLPGFDEEETDDADWIERDLDLYGKRSLHSLLDTTVSMEGSELLRKFLHGDFPGIDEIQRRQELVRSLSRNERMLRRFRLRARVISSRKLNCGKIRAALEKSTEYRLPRPVLLISVTMSILIILSIIVSATGLYDAPIAALLFANLMFYFFFSGKSGKSLEQLNDIEHHVTKLESITSAFKDVSKKTETNLSENYADFFNPDSDFHNLMKRFRKLAEMANYRENQILRLLLNIAFPFDFLLQSSLQKIVPELNSNIGKWLDELTELDSFSALSGFALLNPDYVYAHIANSDKGELDIKSVSHPLMKREQRVANDFSFTKEDELVIITGSNMSGKSTFLRTVGINICLSYAGAPVPAGDFHFSPWKFFTCIRVSDSVFDGISYFYSEVRRLRSLLDLLEAGPDPKVLFFIDEIFKGTNNIERLKGSFAFLKKLSVSNCSGFITTHDIELVRLENEVASVTNYHFRESIEDGKMTFGYKILPGPCPTTNALKIMKMNGLPADE